jgi:hypothetical protein
LSQKQAYCLLVVKPHLAPRLNGVGLHSSVTVYNDNSFHWQRVLFKKRSSTVVLGRTNAGGGAGDKWVLPAMPFAFKFIGG